MPVAILVVIAMMSGPISIEPRTWSWVGSTFAACEDVGIHGAYRVHVEADVQASGSARTIRTLQARATSAIFQSAPARFSLSVSVVDAAGTVRDRATLARPAGSIIEPAPLPTESRRLYLPAGRTLRVAPGETLRFDGAASITTASGACSLGATRHAIDPISI